MSSSVLLASSTACGRHTPKKRRLGAVAGARTWVRGLLCAAGLVLVGGAASARVSEGTGYSASQVYNAAVRYLRVDSGYKIIEKDRDNGYLLFEYPRSAGGEPAAASLEIVESDAGAAFVVQIPSMPSHHEEYLAEALVRKLRTDYGDAPARRKEPKDSDKAKDGDKPKDPENSPDDGSSDDHSGTARPEKKPSDGERDPNRPLPKLRTKEL